MRTKNLTVVILAAGLGTRLGALTKDRPKALTLVNGKPILAYALSWARLLRPQKIIVVGGYLFPQIKFSVKSIDSGAEVVENKNFKTTQRMASLLVARDKIKGDMAVFDGDYIYHRAVAEKMTPLLREEMKILCTNEEHPYARLDMMVNTDGDGRLAAMSKELKEFTHYFGSFFYCPARLLAVYFTTAEEVIRERGARNTHLEDAIVRCEEKGNTVRIASLGSPRWIEIDTPEELSIAEKMIARDPAGYLF